MASNRDVRYTPGKIEFRSDHGTDGSLGTIIGYAAVFDSASEDLGGFTEFIAGGAFDEVLSSNPDVRGLSNHDSSRMLGRTSAGTMRLSQDAKGLRYEIDVADTVPGRDTVTSIKRGDTTGSSFAFKVKSDKWKTVEGAQQRTITAIDKLFDVGPVTFAAYPASVAEASKRSLDAAVAEAEKRTKDAADRPLRAARIARVDSDVAKYVQ